MIGRPGFGAPYFVVSERCGVLAAPVAPESHTVLNVCKRPVFAASSRIRARAFPQAHRRVVLAESLPRSSESGQNLLAWGVGYRQVPVQMVEGGSQIVGGLAIRVLLQGAASRRVEVSHGLSCQGLRVCAREVKCELVGVREC